MKLVASVPIHNEALLDARARFWEKVKVGGEDECWPWIGSRDGRGYGTFAIKRIRVSPFKAHRISFWMETGFDPGDLLVCHSCDNPPCCNPSHLFLGTPADNSADASRKGRLSWSDDNPLRLDPSRHFGGARETKGARKLTVEQVIEIRSRHADGQNMKEIAKIMGTSHSNVFIIVKRKTWRDV